MFYIVSFFKLTYDDGKSQAYDSIEYNDNFFSKEEYARDFAEKKLKTKKIKEFNPDGYEIMLVKRYSHATVMLKWGDYYESRTWK